jgi:hypothetical protein
MVAPEWGSFQGPLDEFDQSNFESQPEQSQIQQNEPKSWGEFQSPHTYQGPVDPTAEEDTLGYIARNLLSFQSRGAEQVLGKPGNIEKFGKDVLSNFPSMGGALGYGISQLIGPERWEMLVKGPPGQQQQLPTSQNIRQVTKNATKGYTEPKTPNEAKVNEFIEDVASTLTGRQPKVLGRTPKQTALINNLGIPAAANAVKQVVSGLGFGEDMATISKLGIWTALSLVGNINASNYASDLLNKGREGVPDNLQISVPRIIKRLSSVGSKLLRSDPRNDIARQRIAKVEEDLANGQTSVRDMMDAYHGVNASKRSKGMFEIGQRPDVEFARSAVDKVKNAINDEILEAAASHPEALENWRNGIQSWAVIQQSKRLTNWIQDKIRAPGGKTITGVALPLFGLTGAGAAVKAPLVAGSIGAATVPLYKAGQVAFRVYQDPRLSHYYWNALSAAAKQDFPMFLNNYNKLNKGLEKDLKSGVSTVKPKDKKNGK